MTLLSQLREASKTINAKEKEISTLKDRVKILEDEAESRRSFRELAAKRAFQFAKELASNEALAIEPAPKLLAIESNTGTGDRASA